MLISLATELVEAVNGFDWDATRVGSLLDRMLPASHTASADERAAALEVLVERLRRAHVDDADGVAHVALACGTLVEHGASAGILGEVLLSSMPGVLVAARRYADWCVEPLRDVEDPWDGMSDDDVVTKVDGIPINRDRFRAGLAEDRGGAVALAYLDNWVLPSIAAFTHDRALLQRVSADPALSTAASSMAQSEAYWLHQLVSVQLDAPWRVVCPCEQRGFEIVVDGITSNFELHALVEDGLVARGLPGTPNSQEVLAMVRGSSGVTDRMMVRASLELYTPAAAPFLCDGADVPLDHVVWREGRPTDVPVLDGRRTLYAARGQIQRSWNAGRSFSQLYPRVEFARELDPAEISRLTS
ncbi:hypothetical protein ACFL6C_01780 [Myxococcota bacterium]